MSDDNNEVIEDNLDNPGDIVDDDKLDNVKHGGVQISNDDSIDNAIISSDDLDSKI